VAMNNIETHTSPDGLLNLAFEKSRDGDTIIGFTGYQWHAHGDILSAEFGLDEDASIRKYIDEILNNRRIIAVLSKGNKILDVWIVDDAIDALKSHEKYKGDGEMLELRYWNGQAWNASR
jgi:hypothetical protein